MRGRILLLALAAGLACRGRERGQVTSAGDSATGNSLGLTAADLPAPAPADTAPPEPPAAQRGRLVARGEIGASLDGSWPASAGMCPDSNELQIMAGGDSVDIMLVFRLAGAPTGAYSIRRPGDSLDEGASDVRERSPGDSAQRTVGDSVRPGAIDSARHPLGDSARPGDIELAGHGLGDSSRSRAAGSEQGSLGDSVSAGRVAYLGVQRIRFAGAGYQGVAGSAHLTRLDRQAAGWLVAVLRPPGESAQREVRFAAAFEGLRLRPLERARCEWAGDASATSPPHGER